MSEEKFPTAVRQGGEKNMARLKEKKRPGFSIKTSKTRTEKSKELWIQYLIKKIAWFNPLSEIKKGSESEKGKKPSRVTSDEQCSRRGNGATRLKKGKTHNFPLHAERLPNIWHLNCKRT